MTSELEKLDIGETLEKLYLLDYKNKEEIDGCLLFWQHLYEYSFEFTAVAWCGRDCDNDKDLYEHLISGTAFFDGIRHIYFGGEDGYLNYPHLDKLSKLIDRIRELEKQICNKEFLK